MAFWGPLLGGAISAGASYLSARLGKKGAEETNRINQEEAQKARDFSERMRNTEWQAGVADMREAGINPAIAYSQGGASSPQGAVAAPAENPYSSAMQMESARKALELVNRQIAKTKEETRITTATADREEARNRAYGFERLPSGSIRFDYDQPGLLRLVRAEIESAEHGANSARAIARRNEYLANISGLAGEASGRLNRLYPALDYFMDQSGRSFRELFRRTYGGRPLFENR